MPLRAASRQTWQGLLMKMVATILTLNHFGMLQKDAIKEKMFIKFQKNIIVQHWLKL